MIKFIKKLSKNVVTMLMIGVLVVILFLFYSKRVNDSINPITVPYAKQYIKKGTEITKDLVGTTIVPPSMLSDTVIRTQSDVIGKYANADTDIPKGSLFFERNVVDKEELPANIILDIPEGYVLYNLSVDSFSTYGNAVYPGNYIDIYLKAMTVSIGNQTNSGKEKKVVLGKLVQNVKVIAVKDYSGKAVFKNIEEGRQPAFLIFAVPADMYVLLKKAEYLRTYDSMLIPVPTRESLKAEPGEIKYSSEALKKWINDVTIWTS